MQDYLATISASIMEGQGASGTQTRTLLMCRISGGKDKKRKQRKLELGDT